MLRLYRIAPGKHKSFAKTGAIPERARVQPSAALPRENQRYLETISFGANEATIFSKRGSPRKGSHIGFKRKSP